MDLYIFRHGETYFSKFEVPYEKKVETAEILPEGIPVIKRLGAYLKSIKTDKNYTSPYLRCLQTVDIVSKKTGMQFETEERLHDYNKYIETVSDMIERIKSFWTELKKQNYKTVVICTHGYPLSVLTHLATKGSVTEKELDSYPKPGVLVVIKNGSVEAVDFN